jgi:hypothetical protein
MTGNVHTCVGKLVFILILCLLAAFTRGFGAVPFIRGNADGQDGLQISDAVRIFLYLFRGGEAPPCLEAADANDSARVDIGDGIYLLNFLFRGGPAPPRPFPTCDFDPTPDALGCEEFPPCREIVCGGFAGFPCPEGYYCELPAGACNAADLLGVCREIPEACPRNFDPVCGCDGKTYSNDCERQRAGAQLAHDGACEERQVCGGIIGLPCDHGFFCDLPPGQCGSADLQGTCVEVSEVCLAIFDPVCGCDGKTYSNDCVRIAARAQKDHDGECEPREE